jgi:hypothetical protein
MTLTSTPSYSLLKMSSQVRAGARPLQTKTIGGEANAPRGDAQWEARLAQLEAYMRTHGDCNVPQGWAEDPPLGSWVNKQRKGKLKLDRGEPSLGMTAARAAQLDKLGFNWSPPKGPKPGGCM